MRRIGSRSGSLLLLLAVAAGPSAQAQGSDAVELYHGSFGDSVAIEVPKFRGLEPALGLSYNSSGGNGVVGVGWSLGAFGSIERMNAQGTPKYDSTDGYLFNGQELVPCAAGSRSPSCMTGGTHSTRMENYQRITFDGTKWDVWDKDGTRSVYSPVHTVRLPVCAPDTVEVSSMNLYTCPPAPACPVGWTAGSATCTQSEWEPEFKAYWMVRTLPCTRAVTRCTAPTAGATRTLSWGLSRVTDTHNNVVDYRWSCDGSPIKACYPERVSYNGAIVQLYWETRPDPVSFTTGVGVPGSRVLRLKTIDVTVDAQQARAYRLTYQTTPSGRSMLSSVRQYGSNVVLDTNGTITAGSGLPAVSFATTARAAGFGPATAPLAALSNAAGWGSPPRFSSLRYADVDGDGRQDVCGRDSTGIACWRATGSGFSATRIAGPAWGAATNDAALSTFQLADVNADGKADACMLLSTGMECYLSNGSAFPTRLVGTTWAGGDPWAPDLDSVRFGDVTGDGRADVCGIDSVHGLACWRSTGSGFFEIAGRLPARLPHATFALADINGDQKADVCATQSPTGISCWLSNGAGFPTQIEGPRPAPWVPETQAYVDLNGDGRTDVCGQAWGGLQCYLSDGTSMLQSFGTIPALARSSGWLDEMYMHSIRYVDINADGRTDVCARDANGVLCWANTGSGFATTPILGPRLSDASGWGNAAYYSTLQYADVTGDGHADLCARNGGDGTGSLVCFPSLAPSELVTTINNGMGGSTVVGYAPSSTWANRYLPAGMVFPTVQTLTTSDGRGVSSVVRYTYENGLWSDAEHRFLGFRRVSALLDALNTRQDTYFHQHVGCASKPDDVYLYDSAGRLYSSTHFTYGEGSSAPFTSLLAERHDFECNRSSTDRATCRETATQLSYDVYGNVTRATELGDVAVTGDERTTRRGYYPNTTNYVVSLPGYENVFDSANVLVKQTLLKYDGATAYATAPTLGDLTARQAWISTGGSATTSFRYDAYGNPIERTDPRQGIWVTTFDPVHHLYPIQRCNPLRHCSTTDWSFTFGLVTRETDANAAYTQTTYDVFGRPTRQDRSDGAWSTTAYNGFGNATTQYVRHAVSDGTPDGLITDEYQDGLGRVYRTVREGGATQDVAFNDTSTRPWKVSAWHAGGEPIFYTTFGYDGAGRQIRETHGDNSFASVTYGVGISTLVDELNHRKTVAVDAYGRAYRVTRVAASGSSTMEYRYDALGNLIESRDAAANLSTATFDSLGRRTNSCDPDSGCAAMHYDAAGNLLDRTDAKNQTTRFTYDALNRVVSKTYPDSTQIRWNYDEAGHGASVGRLTSVTDLQGNESINYLPSGKVSASAKCIRGVCKTTRWTYDLADRVRTTTYPDLEVVTNNYDARGNLLSIPGYLTAATYNGSGQVLTSSYPNGVSETFVYSPSRHWLSSAVVNRGTTPLYQADYGYDAAANVKTWKSTLDAALDFTYGYDELNRLISVTGARTESFTYNAIGNMTSQSGVAYTYGSPAHVHAVTRVGAASNYAYDANGNMSSSLGRPLTWDFDDRLRTGQGATFGYDHAGDRVHKAVGTAQTRYFGKLYEISPAGVETKYVYAGARRIAKKEGTAKLWYHQDHLGSVRLMSDAAGAAVNRYAYGAYGKVLTARVGAVNTFEFSGARMDAETGLNYLGGRYYDSGLARFISAGASGANVEDPQAFNRYAYSQNNPIQNAGLDGGRPRAMASGSALGGVSGAAWSPSVAFAATGARMGSSLSPATMILGGYAPGGKAGSAQSASTMPPTPDSAASVVARGRESAMGLSLGTPQGRAIGSYLTKTGYHPVDITVVGYVKVNVEIGIGGYKLSWDGGIVYGDGQIRTFSSNPDPAGLGVPGVGVEAGVYVSGAGGICNYGGRFVTPGVPLGGVFGVAVPVGVDDGGNVTGGGFGVSLTPIGKGTGVSITNSRVEGCPAPSSSSGTPISSSPYSSFDGYSGPSYTTGESSSSSSDSD